MAFVPKPQPDSSTMRARATIFCGVKDNRRAAEKIVARILDKAERLAIPGLAHMGRPGLDPGTRELIEYPYIIVYEVHEDRGDIVVLSVVHGAQDRENKGVQVVPG